MKKLTYNEFKIMVSCEANKNISNLDFSLAKKLQKENLLDKNYKVTKKGYEVLEQYKVKNAILIAAGKGSRMYPLTETCPKPLVKVHGISMIETGINALLKVGIKDITIVRGYLGEKFDTLKDKYPMIKFIDNKYFEEYNNISSIYLARNLIGNTYILESDLVLKNPNLITKYQYTSNYVGIPMESSDDWCLKYENERISGYVIGDKNPCIQMVGISYFTEEDGKKLRKDVVDAYKDLEKRKLWWDLIPLDWYNKNYNLKVRFFKKEDVLELDSYEELKQEDSSYK